MKKVLLLLGVCGLFAACGKSDCDCTVKWMGESSPISATTPTIAEFDGDCDEVKWNDLSAEQRSLWAAAIADADDPAVLTCVKH